MQELYDYKELIEFCKKYKIEFDENKIDWEWCNYIQNKQWELEKKLEEKILYKNYNNKKSFDDILKQDIDYIRNVLNGLKNNLSFDENYYGWLLDEEKPLTEYFFEEENTIINPKELESCMEDIIENELKINRR